MVLSGLGDDKSSNSSLKEATQSEEAVMVTDKTFAMKGSYRRIRWCQETKMRVKEDFFVCLLVLSRDRREPVSI